MKRLLSTLSAVLLSGLVAFGAGLPLVPSSPNFSDPSAIVLTLNALVNQLNGAVGYAPAQIVSVGSFGTVTGTTPQTLNTQRGIVSFTNATIAAVTTAGVTLNNSLVTATSQCVASITSDNSAAGSFPYIRSVVPTAGVLTFNIANAAAATSTGASTFGISYICN